MHRILHVTEHQRLNDQLLLYLIRFLHRQQSKNDFLQVDAHQHQNLFEKFAYYSGSSVFAVVTPPILNRNVKRRVFANGL